MNKLLLFTLIAIQAQFIFSMELPRDNKPRLTLDQIMLPVSGLKKEDPRRHMFYLKAQELLMANPDSIDNDSKILIDAVTPSMNCRKELDEFVSLFCQYNANVNLTDYEGDTALIKAVQWNKHNIVQILLNHRADPNIKGKGGQTALMKARNQEIADLLLKSNADPDIQDDEGNTALMHFPRIACVLGQRCNEMGKRVYERMKILDYYPNCSLKNNKGETALDIARQLDEEGVIEQLRNVPKLEKLP